MKRLLALLIPFSMMALEVQPWIGSLYELQFLASYAYSRFNHVQGGRPQLTSPFNENVLYFDLDCTVAPDWAIDTDIQFADTTQMDFNFRSWALQGRYLWLDDFIGDPITLSTGGSVRVTPSYALHDVSCYSHANADFEVNFALGKEFEPSHNCLLRLWCYGAVGQANRGSPWVRAITAIETFLYDQHKLGFFAEGDAGFGGHHHVPVDDFDGYAKIRYRAIDLSVRYGYRLGSYGTIRAEYMRRVLAKAYPQNVNSFIVSYLVPFSF
jgi:hypothetical protein